MSADDDVLFASVINLLPLGVWIARAPGGELVHANQPFREIMGVEARPDVGVGGYAAPYGICTRDGAPYPEAAMPFVRALAARATITVDDLVIHRHDGRRVNIRAIARPIFESDVITHVVIAFADITAEVVAEEARRDSEERLRAAHRLEAIGTLAAGVAHDFNNVMASIRLLAGVLRLRERDPARAGDLHRIEAATDRAAALTRSLLTFGNHGGGRVARLAVDQVARTVIDLVSRTFDRRIEVVLEVEESDLRVDGDPSQLEQLLMNLLVNARDAMPDGGTLRVKVSRGPTTVTLEVADTGPGVPPELRTRIFEPYFTTKRAEVIEPLPASGTGLGLATVYGVVQHHGGTIAVLDNEPHGARFVVTLPAAAGAPAIEAPMVAYPLQAGSGRVLLVDDDPLVRQATRSLLEMIGYEVLEAVDGLEALELFRVEAARIDAVLLDVVMPRLGGRGALPRLRAIRDVPVVIATGLGTPEDLETWRGLGAFALLLKPYDLGELSSVLAEAVGAAA